VLAAMPAEALRERVATLAGALEEARLWFKRVCGAGEPPFWVSSGILAATSEEALARAMRRKLVKQEFINVYDPNEIRGKAGMHSSGRSSLSLADEGAMPGRDAIIIREVYETRYEEREIEDLAKLDALDKEKKKDA
ncbi:hypothetical protein LCGC14_3046500, partial [marine sediment metagenome]